ncbi:MAG: hypothetical protein R3E08_05100 [Thiotrichaceae bacterium]
MLHSNDPAIPPNNTLFNPSDAYGIMFSFVLAIKRKGEYVPMLVQLVVIIVILVWAREFNLTLQQF